MIPTRRALIGWAVLSLVALLGYTGSWGLDALMAADAMWLLVVLVDGWRSAPRAAVSVDRLAAGSFSVGRSTEAAYRWRNTARRPARLRLREIRPDRLGGPCAPRDVRVPPEATVKEAQEITPVRRGRERAGWFAVRSFGPWGLACRQWRVALPWSVMVYPGLPASRLKASLAAATRRREAGLRPFRRIGEGRQFESLRAWSPGDDVRHIDWKATARRRRVITRQFEEERRQQVMLLLDAGRLQTATVGALPRFEHVVRAALWLAFAAEHHDDNVGVMIFADGVHHFVTPQRGRRGLQRVLDALAVAEPSFVEPDYPAAFRYLAVHNRKRALTVLFTDVIDRLASQALVANVGSLRPRHLPLIVTLKNPDLDTLAASRPPDTSAAYQKAAAEELLASRDAALWAMRRAGALVLDVPPAHAARAVVDAYQELKRRGRL